MPAVDIEFDGRLEPLRVEGVNSRQMTNLMEEALGNGQRFFKYSPEPGGDDPIVFHIPSIRIIHPADDALGSSY